MVSVLTLWRTPPFAKAVLLEIDKQITILEGPEGRQQQRLGRDSVGATLAQHSDVVCVNSQRLHPARVPLAHRHARRPCPAWQRINPRLRRHKLLLPHGG